MRVREIAIILRRDGFFYYNGQKIKAVYPREGYAVMVFFEPSPIDKDFQDLVWVPSQDELDKIQLSFDRSDYQTAQLIGKKTWGGRRPFYLHEFME